MLQNQIVRNNEDAATDPSIDNSLEPMLCQSAGAHCLSTIYKKNI